MLSGEQSAAYDAIQNWIENSPHWMFTLHGFAGVGKTYLLQHLINNLSTEPLCCAPTGKAASVLKKKLEGGIDATTIHKLLYSANTVESTEYVNLKAKLKADKDNKELAEEVEKMRRQLTNIKVGFEAKGGAFDPDKLIIIDESSMVTKQMLEDFQYTGAKVLFVGDGGQLPPVGDAGWFIKNKADFTLIEVQRQALDSPIIRLSMDIREGRIDREQYQFDDCKIIHKGLLTHDDWINSDQIITGKNVTRRRLNKWFRRKLGYEASLPMEGEKLICLKNGGKDSYPFINGVQMQCIKSARITEFGASLIDIDYEDDILIDEAFYDYHCKSTYDPTQKEEPYFMRRNLLELDWGYAITCHKSQGSEWDKVLLADDDMKMGGRDDRKRWLYTAVTRAKKQLIWMKND